MKKLVALLLTFLIVLVGCKSPKITKVDDDIKTDSIRFKNEYDMVSKDNLYEYATYLNVTDMLDKGTGIIYFGFPTCTLCKEVVPILDNAAKEKKVKTILYYNFKEIRKNNTAEYQKLAGILSDYIKEDEEGNKKIEAPTVVFVNKGRIVGVYIGVIDSSKEEVISNEEKENLKNNFMSLIDKMLIDDISTTKISEE